MFLDVLSMLTSSRTGALDHGEAEVNVGTGVKKHRGAVPREGCWGLELGLEEGTNEWQEKGVARVRALKRWLEGSSESSWSNLLTCRHDKELVGSVGRWNSYRIQRSVLMIVTCLASCLFLLTEFLDSRQETPRIQ